MNKIFLAKEVYRFQLQLCSINHITNFINISHDSYVTLHLFALNRERYQIVEQRSLAPEKSQIVAVCTRWKHRNLNDGGGKSIKWLFTSMLLKISAGVKKNCKESMNRYYEDYEIIMWS